jgi:hypothetical protein
MKIQFSASSKNNAIEQWQEFFKAVFPKTFAKLGFCKYKIL